MKKSNRFYYQIFIAGLGFITLIAATIIYSPVSVHWGNLLVASFFIAFLYLFPLDAQNIKLTLIPVVTLGTGWLYGPVPAGWAVALGIILGWRIRRLGIFEKNYQYRDFQPGWLDAGFAMGTNILPLLGILVTLGWARGFWAGAGTDGLVWTQILFPSILFGAIHGFLYLLILDIFQAEVYEMVKRDILSLVIIEALPIPLVLLSVEAYPLVGDKALIAIGTIPIIIAVLMFGMGTARAAQERRVQELSILDRVSQTLQSTLELSQLLPVIQQQVTQVLGLDNFYVALVDAETNEIWYPLAVKYGKRQNWDRRPMTDRLTDRVIRERRPISLTPQTQSGPNPVGLPPSEDTPASWLGVPLIASDRAIGCLAVSELTSGVEFSSSDIDLLTILSGQVSVAIDNALLYAQAQRRATQLETLNQLSTKVAASLDLQEVMAYVCSSVSVVGGGQRSAIFLLNPGEDEVSLAYAHGLSPEFIHRNQNFSIAGSKRTTCLRSGQSYTVSDTLSDSIPSELNELMQADHIRSFADFPMATPDGQLGFLSVFYSIPHEFSNEEVELLQTFASQAALAVSNARLHALTDEELSRRVNQLAILEAVGRELSSAIHSEELFNLILDYSLEFTNSTSGAVSIFHADENQLELMSSRGYDTQERLFLADQTLTGQAIETKATVNIGNVTQNPRFLDLQNGTTNSQLSVPIIHENRVLGAITLESSASNAFDESEQSLASQLANHAAIALVNADLYLETQRRLREQSTLYQASTQMVGALDVADILQIILEALDAVINPAMIGIYLLGEENCTFVLEDQNNGENITNFQFPSEISASQFTKLGLNDASLSHIQILDGKSGSENFFSEPPQGRTVLFPMRSSQQIIGLVTAIFKAERTLSTDEFDLVQTIIAQGSIALQNAKLFLSATNDQERLSAIINSVGEGILLINPQGKIMLLNEPIRTFTGVPIEELMQISISDLPDSVLKVIGYTRTEIEYLQSDLAQGRIPKTQKTEFQIAGINTERVLERETSAVLGYDGNVIGWMIVLRDETEEFEINQAREMITETIVHDLRSPMSAVVGALDLIDSSLMEDERDKMIKKAVSVANRAADRVLKMIESLLDIARLEAGQMEIIFTPTKIKDVVKGLMTDFEIVAKDGDLNISSNVSDHLPVIMADQEKISRVLMNLLDNAIKFTPKGGSVRISAEQTVDRYIHIQVEDSGLGIPPEFRQKIFDRFTQIPGNRSRTRRGSGLGLAFCRLAVEAHGGKIWVDSPEGKGSIFNIKLPISGGETGD